jgi:hypothetical protein
MKFVFGILIYVIIGLILGLGMMQMVHGKPWLLLVGLLAYVVAFGAIGCLPKKSH